MVIYDLHCHSTYSDGRASVEYLIQKAAEKGYKTGIADHLFCCGNDTLADIDRYLNGVCDLGIPVGGESNIGEEFNMPDSMLNRFDYLVASIHKLFPKGEETLVFNRYFAIRSDFDEVYEGYDKTRAEEYLNLAYRQMESHFSRYRTEILGHCGVMPVYDDIPYWSSTIRDWERAVVALCKKYNVAMEISGMFCQPYERMLRLAKKEGLKFSFASDCHMLEHVGKLGYCYEMIDALNLQESDLYVPDCEKRA